MTPANRGPGRSSNSRRAAGSRPESRRAAPRAAAGAPPRPAGRVARTATPRGGLTTRKIAVLVVLLAFLAIFVAPTVHAYLKEKAETDALAAEVEKQRGTVAELQELRASWDDPRYVERQARDRLRFVRPGERSYIVVNQGKVARVQPTRPTEQHVAKPVDESAPWYGDLWQSVKVAAQGPPGAGSTPPAGPAPSPAPTTAKATP